MKKVTGLLAIFMMVSLLSAGPFVNLAQAITWTTINITSPTMGTVFPDGSNRVQVSAEVSANNIGSMLNKPLMLHVYTCDTNALNCDPNWYSSAPFTLTSLTAPVSVTVSNVLLAFSGKNYIITQLTDAPNSNGAFGYYATTDTPTDIYVNYAGTGFTAIHRFYSPVVKRHLYTADENEANYIIANMLGVWSYEGIAFVAKSTSNCASGENVFRFYSEYTKSHLYTMDENEKSVLIGLNNPSVWRYEGVAYCADTNQASGTIPVYRFYAPFLNTHLYTMDENEKNSLVANASQVWNFEGVAYYTYPQ